MVKHGLMASALTIASPVLAQETASLQPASDKTVDVPRNAAAEQQAQVAAILDAHFPTYDTDGSGGLSRAEFAAWMNRLKVSFDPAAEPDPRWNTAAFRRADGDRSNSVDKAELAGFLNQGSGSGS